MSQTNKETWIIFHCDGEQPGWENRKNPMGNLTDILDEHWDYTLDGSMPKIGDRLRQFHRVEGFEDAIAPLSSTHVRDGDWIVTRIDRYPAASEDCEKREIVVCYCKFSPIASQLELLPKPEVPTMQEV